MYQPCPACRVVFSRELIITASQVESKSVCIWDEVLFVTFLLEVLCVKSQSLAVIKLGIPSGTPWSRSHWSRSWGRGLLTTRKAERHADHQVCLSAAWVPIYMAASRQHGKAGTVGVFRTPHRQSIESICATIFPSGLEGISPAISQVSVSIVTARRTSC